MRLNNRHQAQKMKQRGPPPLLTAQWWCSFTPNHTNELILIHDEQSTAKKTQTDGEKLHRPGWKEHFVLWLYTTHSNDTTATGLITELVQEELVLNTGLVSV